jgi:hypothetical protein
MASGFAPSIAVAPGNARDDARAVASIPAQPIEHDPVPGSWGRADVEVNLLARNDAHLAGKAFDSPALGRLIK